MSIRVFIFGVSAAMLVVSSSSLAAQTAVSGQIVIQERPGEKTEDMINTVIYLEPVGGVKGKASASNTSITLQARQFAM
ncbi:MAG TPA: hypothetical protein VK636_00330 [Gemmatimonadaceae bacterium]|nr:hypothetical protein [Gemmatimonadaceae bacterium]